MWKWTTFILAGNAPAASADAAVQAKSLAIIGVQTTDDGKPVAVKIKRVKGFTKRALKALAERHIAATARVVSDGLGCFRGIAESGLTHEPVIAKRLGRSEKLPQFRWVNTVLANIKNSIDATYRGARKHASRTLAEFEYRFNRRYDLADMIPRLACAAAHAPPMPYRLLKLVEDST